MYARLSVRQLMAKVLIVFPDEWLAYSPTVLNFIDCFRLLGYPVTVLAVDDGSYEVKVYAEYITYIRIHPLLSRLLTKLRLYKTFKVFLIFWHLVGLKARGRVFDLVLAVDYLGFIPAKMLFKDIILLSLEATKNVFYRLVKLMKVDSLIIQTQERKDYLLGAEFKKVYYVQNSPRIPQGLKKDRRNGKKLLFLGNLIAEHGVEECVEALSLLEGYSLFLKGAVTKEYLAYLLNKYQGLIDSRRLFIDSTYVKQEEILSYIDGFDIGFCLYNMKIIGENDFNYISIPSGKLFNYYAVGLP